MADDLATTKLRRAAERIARLGDAVTARDVARRIWQYRQCDRATPLLCALVRCGFGRWQTRGSGPRGGRPTRLFVPAPELAGRSRKCLARKAKTMTDPTLEVLPTIPRTLGWQLRRAILDCGLSRAQLCRNLEISEPALARFMKGEGGLSK